MPTRDIEVDPNALSSHSSAGPSSTDGPPGRAHQQGGRRSGGKGREEEALMRTGGEGWSISLEGYLPVAAELEGVVAS